MLARQDGKKIGGVGMEVEITPRCTCLPPRQHCAEVALGAFTTDSSAMFLVKDHTFYVFFAAPFPNTSEAT